MDRWYRALRSGDVLPERALKNYWSPPPGSVFGAGDAYGYEMSYSEGPGPNLVVISNSIGLDSREEFEGLANALCKRVDG
ncbi:MAG: hypothetical protein ACI82F_001693 [Planctomycetota bacterium]|jgi:hypothetical protein